mmetsp:Transcript_22362/g.48873  ORF Transcript_22362/g.48873 Transcript_22362/m.48873 type:complete len:294 (-) Transcript_22362:94-975(-)
MQQRMVTKGLSRAGSAPHNRCFRSARPAIKPCVRVCASATNGNGKSHASHPSAAETARTIVDIVSEGTLSTLNADGFPVGSPVSYTIDKSGQALVTLNKDTLEMQNLASNSRCSLTVQPTSFPARAVASVTLMGKIDVADKAESQFQFEVEKALYYGGLDQSAKVQELGAADFWAAEPDVLRKFAPELVKSWNEDRAEDIYRIVSHHLQVPLTEMTYAELLWVDRLGMYVRSEVTGREPEVVRVPFYRAVLDERDVRSVITMASQIAWEAERPYNPPLPSIFTDSAAAAAANN